METLIILGALYLFIQSRSNSGSGNGVALTPPQYNSTNPGGYVPPAPHRGIPNQQPVNNTNPVNNTPPVNTNTGNQLNNTNLPGGIDFFGGNGGGI